MFILESITVGVPTQNGSSGSATQASARLDLYRPFAAHCIGFPVVTLGFKIHSYYR